MAYTLEQYQQAFINAHEAGDTDAAKALAFKIQELKQATPKEEDTHFLPEPMRKVLGMGEAGLSAAGNLIPQTIGMIGGGIYGIGRSINEGTFGTAKGTQAATEEAVRGAERFTPLNPQSEYGKEYTEKLGDILGSAVAVMPMAGELAALHSGIQQAHPTMGAPRNQIRPIPREEPIAPPPRQTPRQGEFQFEETPPEYLTPQTNQFEAAPGTWRLDENGVPYRTDLSEEIALTGKHDLFNQSDLELQTQRGVNEPTFRTNPNLEDIPAPDWTTEGSPRGIPPEIGESLRGEYQRFDPFKSQQELDLIPTERPPLPAEANAMQFAKAGDLTNTAMRNRNTLSDTAYPRDQLPYQGEMELNSARLPNRAELEHVFGKETIQQLIDFGYSLEDTAKLLVQQQNNERSSRINASGESAASAEAISRFADETTKGQDRAVIKSDGSVIPLNTVDRVDYRAKPGETVVQRNIGNNEWTVLDSNNVPNTTGVINRASPALQALRKTQGGFITFGGNGPTSNRGFIESYGGRIAGSIRDILTPILENGKYRDINYKTNTLRTAEGVVRTSDNPILKQVFSRYKEAVHEARVAFGRVSREMAPTYFNLKWAEQKSFFNKLRPIFNDRNFIPTPENLSKLGLGEREVKAVSELRESFNSVQDLLAKQKFDLSFGEARGRELLDIRDRLLQSGKSFIDEATAKDFGVSKREALALNEFARTPNFFPRMREGNLRVEIRTPEGKLHELHGVQTNAEAQALVREAKSKGFEANVYDPVIDKPIGKDIEWYDPSNDPEMLFSGHQKYAADIGGYVGDRKPELMAKSIAKYFDQAKNTSTAMNIEQNILKPMRDVDGKQNGIGLSNIYQFINERALIDTNRDFLTTGNTARQIAREISKVTKVDVARILSNTNKAFYALKVLPAPLQMFDTLQGMLRFGFSRSTELNRLGIKWDPVGFSLDTLSAAHDILLNPETRKMVDLKRREGIIPSVHQQTFSRQQGLTEAGTLGKIWNQGDLLRIGNVDDFMRAAMQIAAEKQLMKSKAFEIPGKALNRGDIQSAVETAASRIVSSVLADYTRSELPTMYNQLGPFKQAASALTSYASHSLSNTYEFLKLASQGKNYAGALALVSAAILLSGTQGLSEFFMAPQAVTAINSGLDAAGVPKTQQLPDLKQLFNEQYAKAKGNFLEEVLVKGAPSYILDADVHRSFAPSSALEASGLLGQIAQSTLGDTQAKTGPAALEWAGKAIGAGVKLAGNDGQMSPSDERQAISTLLPRPAQAFTNELARGNPNAVYDKMGLVENMQDRPDILKRVIASGAQPREEVVAKTSTGAARRIQEQKKQLGVEVDKAAMLIHNDAPKERIREQLGKAAEMYNNLISTGEKVPDLGGMVQNSIKNVEESMTITARDRAYINQNIGQGTARENVIQGR